VLAGLTSRQQAILVRSDSEGVATIAADLGCSVGTVVNEQRRIGDLVARLTEDSGERDRVLNITVDLVYEEDDG
jgi:DNA-directed RNA polymerase specialized sigma24 family protein